MPICLKTTPKSSEIVCKFTFGGISLPFAVLFRAAKEYFNITAQIAKRINIMIKPGPENKTEATAKAATNKRGMG
jgi:hypothetical protein